MIADEHKGRPRLTLDGGDFERNSFHDRMGVPARPNNKNAQGNLVGLYKVRRRLPAR